MTARKFFNRFGGFTLVELLIVIALLAIIALIVIAAINPIEQANRARDTGMKSDASQLVSAIDRYFAAKEEFPWVTSDNNGGGSMVNDDEFGYIEVDDITVGLCALDPCTGTGSQGLIITGQELKPEFLNRKFIDATNLSDNLYIGKAYQDQSIYICYIPSAQSNRQKACEDDTVFQVNADGTRNTTYDCDPATPPVWIGTGMLDSYMVCLPQ